MVSALTTLLCCLQGLRDLKAQVVTNSRDEGSFHAIGTLLLEPKISRKGWEIAEPSGLTEPADPSLALP